MGNRYKELTVYIMEVTTDQKAVKTARAMRKEIRSCHAQKAFKKSPPENDILGAWRFKNSIAVTKAKVRGETYTDELNTQCVVAASPESITFSLIEHSHFAYSSTGGSFHLNIWRFFTVFACKRTPYCMKNSR